MRYSWSVNLYDEDGDIFDTCVLAHINDGTILRFENVIELRQFAEKILNSIAEIKETYPNA